MQAWMDDPRAELEELTRALRAYGEWEEQIGGLGWPTLPVPPWPDVSPNVSSVSTEAELRAVTEPARSDAVEPEPVTSAFASALREQSAPPSTDRGSDIGIGETPEARLRVLQEEAAGCRKCELASGRTRSVFSRGSHRAELVFVGEGPGENEDLQGYPFVGRAGQLLDKMVGAMGYGRDDVYICNVVKCRPPGNRTPKAVEANACMPFLQGQLEVVRPKAIVALGRCASEHLGLCEPGQSGGWRGRWGSYRGIPVMPTYHPAFLLRSPQFKRPVWEDLKKVMARLGKPLRTG